MVADLNHTPANIPHMTDERTFFSELAGRKITVVEMATHLGVSRNTASNRLNEGLTSDEILTLARALHINPTLALYELKKLTLDEIQGFLESDGTLLATATEDDLVYELAERIIPAEKLIELGQRAEQRRQAAKLHNIRDLHIARSTPNVSPIREDESDAASTAPLEPEEGDDDYHNGA